MKKLVFKKWVNWLLIGVALLSVMVMASECESTLLFIGSKAIALIVFTIIFKLLSKFGRKEVL